MAETFYDSPADPFNSDAYQYYHLQSTGYGGSWAAINTGALNYPPSAPNRLFVSLPMRIDQSALAGARPMSLKIGATSLTRVSSAPAANEYRVAPTTSERRDIVELHSSRTGVSLDFDFYGFGSVFNADDHNTIDITGPITSLSTITGSFFQETLGYNSLYRTSGGVESTVGVHNKIIQLGDWNMDSTNSLAVTHNIANWLNIMSVTAIIRNDADNGRWVFFTNDNTTTSGLGQITLSSTQITLERTVGSIFDSTNFDATSYSRGFLFIVYME